MAKCVYLNEVETLLWFPDDPQFGQWLTKPTFLDYGILIEGRVNDKLAVSVGGELVLVETLLINWSNKPNTYGFQVHKSSVRAGMFHTSEPFKFMKERMNGIVMKTGFLMIERPDDVVMFRLLYGEAS
jgi:hypothetical protein